MRSCPACGTVTSDGSKFCAECGARLPASAVDEEQRKPVTVLFCDVTGSTSLGERLEPESLRRMLARFFDAARTVVERHGGTVEKFIGDAVMAVFGVPLVHEDDALRALRAALDLMASMNSLNDDLRRSHGATLQIRIGVNSGDVVTGTSERLATGDAVNVAARLEQLAEPGQIYVGELTVRLAGVAASFAELDPAVVKGKTAPVRVFQLLSAGSMTRAVRATPMIGRKRQLEMLRGAFDQSVADRACVLFTVLGAAGVGKSRLVAEFLSALDATVVRGRCLSYGSGVGLLPVVEIVRQLQDGAAASEVAAALDEDDAVAAAVRSLLSGDVAVPTSATEIAWAVRKLLERAATVRPLVVVVDDLHWAEPPLLDLLEHVATLSRDTPILLLVMARPELLERRESWGTGALNASTVLLEPLSAAEAEELIDLLSTNLDAAGQARVREAAAGNPLFAEEMVALVEASGGSEVGVPPTIQALLAARLDQLQPAERRALERGSVEGQSFHRSAVAELIPDDPELPQRLIGLVRKDLLRPDHATLDRDEAFRFRHLLLRDAAYDRLPKSARAELHERFARWLDKRATELPERDSLVGYHLEQAYRYRLELGPEDGAARGLAGEAAARLEAAGRRQMIRGDLTGAIDLLDRATSLAPQDKPDVSLQLGIAKALGWCGRPDEAVARAAAAAEAAARAGDRVGALQAGVVREDLASRVGKGTTAELQRRIDEALPEFQAAGDDSALAWCWSSIWVVTREACRFGDALDAAKKTQFHAERANDPFLIYAAGNVAADIQYGPTPIPEALDMLERVRATSASNLWVDASRAILLAYAGEFDEARKLADQTQIAFRQRGMSLAAAIAQQMTAEIEIAAGDFAAAVAGGREGCAELERMGERGYMPTNATMLAEALYLLGEDDEAEHWIGRALELADPDDVITQAQARVVRAVIAARRGDVGEAETSLRDGMRVTSEMQEPIWQGRAAMYAATVLSTFGHEGAAREQLQRAFEYFSAKGSTVYAARAAAALAAR